MVKNSVSHRPPVTNPQPPAGFRDYRAKSWWLEQAGVGYVEHPELEGVVRADVLIIGGGFTGVSAAYHLKRDYPELRVVLLEADVVGYGASGRNAGFVTTLLGQSPGLMALRFGRRGVAQARRYMERAVDYVDRLVREYNLDCEYAPTELLRVATSPASARRLRRESEYARPGGADGAEWIGGEWIGADEVRALVDSPTYLGALRTRPAALLNPARFVRELKRIATDVGAEVYEHSPVIHLEFTRPVRAQTPRGAVEADSLVLATNAYTAQFAQVKDRQYPVHTYVVLTEPLTPEQLDSLGWRGGQAVADARYQVHQYRLTPDHRLLVGGGDVHYFYGDFVGIDRYAPAFDHLERFIHATFPALRGIRISHHWGGPVSATFDMAPVLGYAGSGRRVIYAAGYMGHGMALAVLNGQTVSDMLGNRHTELTDAFFVNRATLPIPPEPLRAPLVNGILGLMHARDAFDERHGLGAQK